MFGPSPGALPQVRATLIRDITGCSVINDACAQLGNDPLTAGVQLRHADPKRMVLKVEKNGDVYTFSILEGQATVWTSWLKNVKAPG